MRIWRARRSLQLQWNSRPQLIQVLPHLRAHIGQLVALQQLARVGRPCICMWLLSPRLSVWLPAQAQVVTVPFSATEAPFLLSPESSHHQRRLLLLLQH